MKKFKTGDKVLVCMFDDSYHPGTVQWVDFDGDLKVVTELYRPLICHPDDVEHDTKLFRLLNEGRIR